MEKFRLFIAIELPEAVTSAMAELQARLRGRMGPGGRTVGWVQPEGAHLTLKFLGDVLTPAVPAVKDALAGAVTGLAPFTLATGILGSFPNARQPRVVWLGLTGNLAQASRAQQAVEAAIGPLGYPPEKRPFMPHLTLGRVRDRAQPEDLARLAGAIEAVSVPPPIPFRVERLSLMRSFLAPHGARYIRLLGADLTPPAPLP